MKVFQVVNNKAYRDYSKEYDSAREVSKFFSDDVIFRDAPDDVFVGFYYDGHSFMLPEIPDGFTFDYTDGIAYNDDKTKIYDIISGCIFDFIE